jgi:phosphatidylinositol alpha-1,6-mannosyltransferase
LSNYQLSIKNYRPGPACPVGRADQPWADGLKDKIIIINQTTDAERDQWYNASDIFIMPSRNINGDFEGFGIVYLEANLAGKPVIAGRSGGVGDAVIDGLNGLMVDPENVNDIREKIIKLALNPELRHKLGEQGRRRVIEEFNWKKQVNKIYKITQL